MRASAFLYGVTLSAKATAYNLMLGHFGSNPRIQRRRERGDDRRDGARVPDRLDRVRHGDAARPRLPVASFAAYVLIAVYYLVPHGVDADIRPASQDPSRDPRKPANGGSS